VIRLALTLVIAIAAALAVGELFGRVAEAFDRIDLPGVNAQGRAR
jgi:hypothetical protein